MFDQISKAFQQKNFILWKTQWSELENSIAQKKITTKLLEGYSCHLSEISMKHTGPCFD